MWNRFVRSLSYRVASLLVGAVYWIWRMLVQVVRRGQAKLQAVWVWEQSGSGEQGGLDVEGAEVYT
jgi:hypothetical protein